MLLLRLFVTFVTVSTALASFSVNFDRLLDKLRTLQVTNNNTFAWSDLEKRVEAIVDSVLNPNLRSLYGLHKSLGTSGECGESLYALVMGTRNRKEWAVKMLDASGKPAGGYLEGTMMHFGSFDQCLRVRANGTGGEELFRGRYCMVGFHTPLLSSLSSKTKDGRSYVQAYGPPPDWIREIIVRADGYLKRVALWFGTCIPSTCTQEDLLKISTPLAEYFGFSVEIKDCQIDEPFVWPWPSVIAVSVLAYILFLCTIGTSVDIICRWRRSDPTNKEADHMVLRVLKAFSVLANTESLFRGNVGGGSLTCFHGVRFLSATWIVLGHTYFFVDTWKYIKYRRLLGFVDQFDRHLPAAVIENFTIPVGSFFFMSGFLLVYTTWRVLEKSKGKYNLLLFVVHKFWRMTPAIGLTLTLLFCLPLIDSGPIWNSTLNPLLEKCEEHWWKNLLFINNLWDQDQFCLLHTWYLGALMQFHIAGIILLLITFRWPIPGILLSSLVSVACFATTAWLVVKQDYPMPGAGIIKDMDIIDDYHSQIYLKPYAHFTTYLVGMIVAYAVLKYHDRKISPKYQVLGWMLAIFGGFSSVYGLYGPANSIAVRVLYITGHRIGWALSIGWMIYACAAGIGGFVNRLLSWSAMAPLGQLSYLTYLIHPLVIIYRNACLRERVYYGHTELVFSFVSNLVVSLFLAFIGYVAVETPFMILEKMIFRKGQKADFKKVEYEVDPRQVATKGIKELNP